MIRTRLPLAILTIASFFLLSADTGRNFMHELKKQVQEYNDLHPEEKVFLHLDRNSYAPGEDIWFRGYVLNRSSQQASDLSRTLKVLLLTPDGTTLSDTEFEIHKGQVRGSLQLPERSDEGPYKLLAWSSWMRNQESSTVFSRDLLVKKTTQPELLVPNVLLDLQLHSPSVMPGEEIKIGLNAQTTRQLLQDVVSITYRLHRNGRTIQEEERQVLNNGEALWRYRVPDTLRQGLYSLHISASHQGEIQERSIPVQVGIPDYKVQFMPEGGDLVAGLESKVAWRAVNQYGQGLDIEARIVDAEGRVQASTKTQFEGMGYFYIKPKAGESYQMEFRGPEGNSYTFPLPAVAEKDYVISYLGQNEEHLYLKIQSAYTSRYDRYYLRGLMQNSFRYVSSDRIAQFDIVKVPLSKFREGIAQFTLYDKLHNPRAERLVYIHKGPSLNISVRTNKQYYVFREKVAVDIEVRDEEGRPVEASLSLAAVDTLFYREGSLYDHIGPYINLQSELQGNWRLPDSFTPDTEEGREILDLMMLTYGWRRFNKLGTPGDRVHQPQDYITGQVFYRSGKDRPAPGARVQVIPLGLYNIQELTTDSLGRFYIDKSLLSSDLEGVIIRGLSAKDKENVRIKLNIDERDPFTLSVLAEEAEAGEDVYGHITYQSDVVAGKRYVEMEDFHGYLMLSEVLIQEKRMRGERILDFPQRYRNFKSNTRKGNTLVQGTNFLDLLRQVTNFSYHDPNTGAIYFRGLRDIGRVRDTTVQTEIRENNGALFVVNGSPYGQDYRAFNFISVEMIKEITVIKSAGTSAAFGGRAGEGVIFVNLKDDIEVPRTREQNFVVTDLYDKPREFYAPKYKTKINPKFTVSDYRATIHWEPVIETDAMGRAHLEFYNGDRRSVIVGRIEGLGADGRLGSARFRYEVK